MKVLPEQKVDMDFGEKYLRTEIDCSSDHNIFIITLVDKSDSDMPDKISWSCYDKEFRYKTCNARYGGDSVMGKTEVAVYKNSDKLVFGSLTHRWILWCGSTDDWAATVKGFKITDGNEARMMVAIVAKGIIIVNSI